MSLARINLNPDLKRLKDEGYELTLSAHGFLVLATPYVTSGGVIAYGHIVSDISFTGDVANAISTHQVWFSGEYPCHKDGTPIEGIRHSSETRELYPGMVINHYFSNKPKDRTYNGFHEKMTRYAEIISNEATAIDSHVLAKTFKPVVTAEADTPFIYEDSASSRAGITSLALKCAQRKVAIIGLGGTGSYVLDLIAKTHVKEIHLFDGDIFYDHNAFRAPGAASLDDLMAKPTKVAYFASKYGSMRRGIFAHEIFISEDSVSMLSGFDCVFLCVDKPFVRRIVFQYLTAQSIPFIDSGMDIQYVSETDNLFGACRVTTCKPEKHDHFPKYVSLDDAEGAGVYSSNIQIADLNALNACFAVMRWKKLCGFYQDYKEEHQSVYTINTHHLSKDESTINDKA